MNFALYGCDDNTPTDWFEIDEFIDLHHFKKAADLVVSLKSATEGFHITETKTMHTGSTYLFRTDRYHSAYAKELNGVMRVIGCIHFVTAAPWDDLVNIIFKKGWLEHVDVDV
jgi:hypothetical protein